MKIILFAVLALVAYVSATAEPPRPVFPPSTAYQVDYTYDTQFFDPSTQSIMTGLLHKFILCNWYFIITIGTFYSDGTGRKFASIAKDDQRTTETVLFRYDQRKTFVLSKFGEFGTDCKSFSNDTFLGTITVVPPVLTSAQFMNLAYYEGDSTIDGIKVNSYSITVNNTMSSGFFKSNDFLKHNIRSNKQQLLNQKIITLFFVAGSDPNRPLVKAVEKINAEGQDLVVRTAKFQKPTIGSVPSNVFDLPRGVSCTSK